MDEVKTAYRCPKCEREVLNRRVSHCLFCSAALPASMLLAGAAAVTAGAAIASTDFQLEPMVSKEPPPTLAQDLQGAAGDMVSTAGDAVVNVGTIVADSVDVVDLAASAVEVAGDVVSGIGDLLGGLADMF